MFTAMYVNVFSVMILLMRINCAKSYYMYFLYANINTFCTFVVNSGTCIVIRTIIHENVTRYSGIKTLRLNILRTCIISDWYVACQGLFGFGLVTLLVAFLVACINLCSGCCREAYTIVQSIGGLLIFACKCFIFWQNLDMTYLGGSTYTNVRRSRSHPPRQWEIFDPPLKIGRPW